MPPTLSLFLKMKLSGRRGRFSKGDMLQIRMRPKLRPCAGIYTGFVIKAADGSMTVGIEHSVHN